MEKQRPIPHFVLSPHQITGSMKLHCIVFISSVVTGLLSIIVIIFVIKSVIIPNTNNKLMRSVCTIRDIEFTETSNTTCVKIAVDYMNAEGSLVQGYLLSKRNLIMDNNMLAIQVMNKISLKLDKVNKALLVVANIASQTMLSVRSGKLI